MPTEYRAIYCTDLIFMLMFVCREKHTNRIRIESESEYLIWHSPNKWYDQLTIKKPYNTNTIQYNTSIKDLWIHLL